jgi:hypothetical protein
VSGWLSALTLRPVLQPAVRWAIGLAAGLGLVAAAQWLLAFLSSYFPGAVLLLLTLGLAGAAAVQRGRKRFWTMAQWQLRPDEHRFSDGRESAPEWNRATLPCSLRLWIGVLRWRDGPPDAVLRSAFVFSVERPSASSAVPRPGREFDAESAEFTNR